MNLFIPDFLILVFLSLLLLIVIVRTSLLIGLEQSLEQRTSNDSKWDKTHTFIASLILPFRIEGDTNDSAKGVIKALNVLQRVYWGVWILMSFFLIIGFTIKVLNEL